MPARSLDQTTDTSVQSTVKLTDKKAAGQLAALFCTYHSVRKDRPKPPSEASVLPLIWNGAEERVDTMLTEFVADFKQWTVKMNNLLAAIAAIGDSNPSAAIAIVPKGQNRPVIQVNGDRLLSALLREDNEILRGSLPADTGS